MNLLRLITERKGAAAVNPAQAFITAAGITDPTQQSAIIQLVNDLQAYGLWSKMNAIYPFVGGTANTHKYNLKDPRDLDAAFRLQFNGGWTHSSTGALPNGVDGWANTYLKPNPVLPSTDAHMSFYSRTNIVIGTMVDIGDTPTTVNWYFSAAYGGYGVISNLYNGGFLFGSGPPPDTLGLYTSSRISNTSWGIYKNQTVLMTRTTAISAYPASNVVLARNQSGEYSAREFAFVSIGSGLSDTDVSNLYTAVQTFQTTLGRQV